MAARRSDCWVISSPPSSLSPTRGPSRKNVGLRPRCRRSAGTDHQERFRTTQYIGSAVSGKPRTDQSRPSVLRPEQAVELGRHGLVELVVGAGSGILVGPPPHEPSGVTEPATLVARRAALPLHVLEGDLGHQLEPDRVPREVLAAGPARLAPGHPVRGLLRFGPLAPVRADG